MRDTRSRRLTNRRLFRRPAYANRRRIAARFSPNPKHQRSRKRTEARKKAEHEELSSDAQEPTVQIPCGEHDRTSCMKVWAD